MSEKLRLTRIQFRSSMARGLSGDGQSFSLKSSLERSVIVLVRNSSGDIC